MLVEGPHCELCIVRQGGGAAFADVSMQSFIISRSFFKGCSAANGVSSHTDLLCTMPLPQSLVSLLPRALYTRQPPPRFSRAARCLVDVVLCFNSCH